MVNKSLVLLLLIFCGALFIRTYQLNEIPVGFHGDEVNIAYNAWAVKETGKDIDNNFLPTVINQWGDYRAVGYYYFAAISLALFGLSDWAVRFPAAFFGSLSVIFLWLIADKLYNRNIAWISAIILAILPWHIIISRSTSESIVSLAFVLLGIYSGLKALRATKPTKWIILSFISFSISFVTYHAARYGIPIFLFGACALLLKQYDIKKKIILISFTFLIGATSYLLFTTSGSVRASQTSIFTFPETKFVLEESIREDGTQNPLFTRLWHNKLTSYATKALENGLQHVSASYLIFGNFMPNRYLAGKATLMPLWMYGFFIIGFCAVVAGLFTKNNKQSLLLLWALAASIVPAAFTFEDIPNVQRSSLFIPVIVLLVAIGIYRSIPLIASWYKITSVAIFTLIVVYASGQFAHEYFSHSVTHKTWYRNSGEKELVVYLNTVNSKNEPAFVTASADNNEMYYFWYLRKHPKVIQSLPKDNRLKVLFPTFSFLPVDCFLTDKKEIAQPDYLYVSLGDCKDVPNTNMEKIIYREDGTAAFKIFRPSN
ncbi:glycosyltransferase family 39 protein [Patescibacteria group bacterium]|nr:glycosyltransferase family 39 protein [Patescibacteria group bacterium]